MPRATLAGMGVDFFAMANARQTRLASATRMAHLRTLMVTEPIGIVMVRFCKSGESSINEVIPTLVHVWRTFLTTVRVADAPSNAAENNAASLCMTSACVVLTSDTMSIIIVRTVDMEPPPV